VLTALFNVSPEWSAEFLLVLARISSALVAMPLFGAKGVPPQAKIGLALLLSLIVLPLHARPIDGIPTNLLAFASILGSEVLVGLCLGVLTGLIVQGLAMGAAIVGIQMGFGLGELFDPLTGAQTDTMSQFYWMLVTLVFFAVNGHQLVVLGLLRTFEVVPAGSADITLLAGDRFVPFVVALFGFAVRVAMPVMGALLLTDLALGLVARTVPQMNILVEGFPVKAAVGVLVLVASMPLVTAFMGAAFHTSLPQVNSFLVAP
jgi:flagellar biosynthetic protein FliR